MLEISSHSIKHFDFEEAVCLRNEIVCLSSQITRLVDMEVKASASRATDLGSFPAFHAELFPGRVVPTTSELVPPMATPARRLGIKVSTGTGWPGVSTLGEVAKFDPQLLSQCGSTYNCLSRSVPEIH